MSMDVTRERISLIFELSAIFLIFQMVLRCVSAAVVWAILARISGLARSLAKNAPRYLKLLTQSSFSHLTHMSVSTDAIGVVGHQFGLLCIELLKSCQGAPPS